MTPSAADLAATVRATTHFALAMWYPREAVTETFAALSALVARCEKAEARVAALTEALLIVPLAEWQELADDDTMDLIDADVMRSFLLAARAALSVPAEDGAV